MRRRVMVARKVSQFARMPPRMNSLRSSCWPLVLLLGLLFGGCAQAPDSNESASESLGNSQPVGGCFSMAQDNPGLLDPARVDDSYEAAIVNQLFDGLLSYDDNLNAVPSLAESWVISGDGLEYTLQLKEGVHFHDGSELDAEDVVFSLSRIFRLDPEQTVLAREYLSHIRGSREYAAGETESVAGLKAVDELTVSIELDQPYASFLSVLASEMARVVPKDYVERVGDDAFGRAPIGSGPFAFERWVENDRIVLQRFGGYHTGPAAIDSVVFELPDVGHRDYSVARFLDKKICSIEVPPNRLSEFRGYEGVEIYSRQELSLGYMALNVSEAPFDDPLIREAFLLAVDSEALCSLYEGGRMNPTGILPPGMPGYDPKPKLPAQDLERARELLALAGHADGKGLPVIVHASANESESEKQLHDEIVRQVGLVGFNMVTVYMNWLEFEERIHSGELHSFSLGWVADLPDPASMLDPLFHSAGSNNLFGYSNARVDALLDEARSSRSNQQRWQLYREAERLILSEAPIVPLYHAMSVVAVHSQVHGFGLSPLGVGNLILERVWFGPADAKKAAR